MPNAYSMTFLTLSILSPLEWASCLFSFSILHSSVVRDAFGGFGSWIEKKIIGIYYCSNMTLPAYKQFSVFEIPYNIYNGVLEYTLYSNTLYGQKYLDHHNHKV